MVNYPPQVQGALDAWLRVGDELTGLVDGIEGNIDAGADARIALAKAKANGLASLNSDGFVPLAQRGPAPFFNVRDYGAKGDGTTDDTMAIQSAITAASAAASSADFVGAGYGTVYLPAGRYKVTNLWLKSNVSIKGAGFRQVSIIAAGTSGYVFDRSTNLNKGTRSANIQLEGFTLGPATLPLQGYQTTRPVQGGIDLSFSVWCSIRDVFIHNLAGTALNLTCTYDLVTVDLHIMYCGVDSSSPALLYADDGVAASDTTNAVHHFGLRVERCPVMLRVTGAIAPINNTFTDCKFEWNTAGPALNGPAIQIESCQQLKFVGCMLVSNTATYPLVRAGLTAGTLKVAGLRFVATDFTASAIRVPWAFDATVNCTDVAFDAVDVYCFGKGFTFDPAVTPTITGSRFYGCMAPVIDGVGMLISGTRLTETYAPASNTYAIKASSKSHISTSFIKGSAASSFQVCGISMSNSTTVADTELDTLGAALGFFGTGSATRGVRFTAVTLQATGNTGFAGTNVLEYLPVDRTVTAATTLTDVDRTVTFNSASAISQALPAVGAVTPFRRFDLVNIGAGSVTVPDTVSGTASRVIPQWSSLTVYSNGTAWLAGGGGGASTVAGISDFAAGVGAIDIAESKTWAGAAFVIDRSTNNQPARPAVRSGRMGIWVGGSGDPANAIDGDIVVGASAEFYAATPLVFDSADLNGLADGTAITSVNTAYNVANSGGGSNVLKVAQSATAAPLVGSASARIIQATGGAVATLGVNNLTALTDYSFELWFRYVGSLPANLSTLVTAYDDNAWTATLRTLLVQVSTAGQITILTGKGATVATQLTSPVNVAFGTAYRLQIGGSVAANKLRVQLDTGPGTTALWKPASPTTPASGYEIQQWTAIRWGVGTASSNTTIDGELRVGSGAGNGPVLVSA